jgi:hypothetical protein
MNKMPYIITNTDVIKDLRQDRQLIFIQAIDGRPTDNREAVRMMLLLTNGMSSMNKKIRRKKGGIAYSIIVPIKGWKIFIKPLGIVKNPRRKPVFRIATREKLTRRIEIVNGATQIENIVLNPYLVEYRSEV